MLTSAFLLRRMEKKFLHKFSLNFPYKVNSFNVSDSLPLVQLKCSLNRFSSQPETNDTNHLPSKENNSVSCTCFLHTLCHLPVRVYIWISEYDFFTDNKFFSCLSSIPGFSTGSSNHSLRDAQKMCILIIVGTLLDTSPAHSNAVAAYVKVSINILPRIDFPVPF